MKGEGSTITFDQEEVQDTDVGDAIQSAFSLLLKSKPGGKATFVFEHEGDIFNATLEVIQVE